MSEAVDIAIQGMTIEVENRSTWEETNQWFPFSEDAIAAQADGLNAETAGVTGLPLLALRKFTRPRNWHSRFTGPDT